MSVVETAPAAAVRLRITEIFASLQGESTRVGLPTVFVLEGGYAAADLGTNAVNVLEGFEQA